MNKKQNIESKKSVPNLKKSADLVELHVLVANSPAWRPDNWQSYDRGSSISIGFIKVELESSLVDVRSLVSNQITQGNLPEQYVFLRQIGRGSTICSARQERSLKAKDFAPPIYPHAEICLLSSENMVFHSRNSRMGPDSRALPKIITSSHSPSSSRQTLTQNGHALLPPLTPVNRMTNNMSAPLHSIERSKSPSFRSLQSLEGNAYAYNNELMMAEIAFLEAKRALADAHVHALRNQFLHNQNMIMENGLGSEGESEDEEAEKRRKEEEQMKREEEERERERIRDREDEERKRMLEIEEEKRRIKLERQERERQIEAEIQAEEDKTRALFDLKRKAAEKRLKEEEARIAELERVAREEEEERRRREDEVARKRREIDKNWIKDLIMDELDMGLVESDLDQDLDRDLDQDEELEEELVRLRTTEVERETSRLLADKTNEIERARLAEEMYKREQERLKEAGESDDEEMDEAMRLIDDLTQTPRPWHASKDQRAKKIVRVPKEYTKEELEEVAYLRAKIETYRSHRRTMETKHHDLLNKLAEMEKNWNEDEQKEFESKWRPKCKEEEVKTPQLYERNRQLRLELRMLYKKADTVISHVQAMKQSDDRKGMAFPSIKNNLRINLQRLQNEATELRKRTATAQIKYEAEKANREGVEMEVKQLRQELINSKISSSVGAAR